METINAKVTIKVKEEDFLQESDISKVKIVVPMVNPQTLTLGSEIYTISSNPATEKVLVKSRGDKVKSIIPVSGLADLRYFAINRTPIEALSLNERDGKKMVTVNGDIHLPVSGMSERNTVENVFFTNYDDAKHICKVCTRVELAKIKLMKDEVNSVEEMLQKQADADLF